MNYISFSLYGNNKKYFTGAIANMNLIKLYYPSWQTVFYCDNNCPIEILSNLESLGARVITRQSNWHQNGMFWRFKAFEIPDADYVIIRDTDSRISYRESAAVNQWIVSNKSLHIMRDHPFHKAFIMGGMWGGKASDILPVLKSTEKELRKFSSEYCEDQEFLKKYIYMRFRKNSTIHDSIYKREFSSRNFPSKRIGLEYVGESLDNVNCFDENLRSELQFNDRKFFLKYLIILRDFVRFHIEKNNI